MKQKHFDTTFKNHHHICNIRMWFSFGLTKKKKILPAYVSF